jgi:DNA ligase 1
MENIAYAKKLYGVTKKGAIKIWYCVVKDVAGTGYIIRSSCTKGAKSICHTSIVTKGKNIGKSNETSPVEQAVKDAESKYNKKWDEGYRTTEKAAKLAADPRNNRTFKPMLASSYDKQGKKIKFPCFAQPKLDGIRCLAKRSGDEIIMWSRSGKEFTTLDHFKPAIKLILNDGEACDGEIYIHGKSFQEIQKSVSKLRESTYSLEYHIYDYPYGSCSSKDSPFEHRVDILETRMLMAHLFSQAENSGEYSDRIEHKCMSEYLHKIMPVETKEISSALELETYEMLNIQNGYEGIMARNGDSIYTFGHRSYDLQKVKRFQDSEYEIIDVLEGTGVETGCAIFVCRCGGNTFKVRPTGSHAQRKEWFNLKSKLIGQELKVKFQELTDDGIPRFPVGLGLRPDWDK